MGTRRFVDAPDHEPRDVRDVGGKHGSYLTRDVREPREIDGPRDRRASAKDQLGPRLQSHSANLVEVDPTGLTTNSVAHGAEPGTRYGHRPPVGQMSAVQQ